MNTKSGLLAISIRAVVLVEGAGVADGVGEILGFGDVDGRGFVELEVLGLGELDVLGFAETDGFGEVVEPSLGRAIAGVDPHMIKAVTRKNFAERI